MANEQDVVGELVAQLSVDVSKLERANRTALDKLKQLTGDMEDQAEKGGRSAGERLSRGMNSGLGGLNRSTFMELEHSVRSSMDALAAGANPMRILAMEGPRVAQALGNQEGGVAGALSGLAKLINPTVVGFGVVIGTFVALAKAAADYGGRIRELTGLHYGLDAGSKMTASDMEDISEAAAKAGTASVGSAAKFVEAFASIGYVSKETALKAVESVNDLAAAMGIKAPEAADMLKRAMQDPHEGIVELTRATAAFSQEQVIAIQHMADTGDRAGAVAAMIDGLKNSVSGAESATHGWSVAFDKVGRSISVAWANLGKLIDRLAGLDISKADRLATLEAERSAMVARGGGLPGKGGAGAGASTAALDTEIAQLRAQISGEAAKNAEEARNKENQDWRDNAGLTGGMAEQRRKLNDQITLLQKALDSGDLHGSTTTEVHEQILRARKQLRRLDAKEGINDGLEDQGPSMSQSAQSALDRAKEERAKASGQDTADIYGKALFDKQAINDDYDRQRSELDKQRLSISKAKLDTQKKSQLALLDEADRQLDLAQAAAEQAVDRKAALEVERANYARETEVFTAQRDSLNAQLQTTKDLAQRKVIHDQILALDRQELNDKLERARLLAVAQNPANATQINADYAKLHAYGNAKIDAEASNYSYDSPIDKWRAQIPQTAADMNNSMQTIGVQGLNGLTNAIDDAIMKSKDLGKAFHEIAQGIIADLIKIGIERSITLPLANALFGAPGGGGGGGFLSTLSAFIPHFATGTENSPGGMALVGENGPELINLPHGSQVMSNSTLRGLSGPDMNSRPAIFQGPQFDLRGAVMTQDLINQMTSISMAHAQRAGAAAVQTARQIIPNDINRKSASRFR